MGGAVKQRLNFNTKGRWWLKVRDQVVLQRRLNLATLNAVTLSSNFSFGHAKILVKLEFYPIQNGGVGAKRPLPTIFSPVTSANV